MHKLTLIGLFLLNYVIGFSQNLDPITIAALTEEAKECDSIGQRAISRLGGYYYGLGNKTKLRHYTQREITCAEANQDQQDIIRAYYHLLLYHQSFSGKDSVSTVAQFMLTSLESDTSFFAGSYKAKALFQIGSNYYFDYNDYTKAYRYYQKAKDLALSVGDMNQYGAIVRAIVQLYTYDKKCTKALQIADEALAKIKIGGRNQVAERNLVDLKYQRAQALINLPVANVEDKASAYQAYKNRIHFFQKRNSVLPIVNTMTSLLKDFDDILPLDTLLDYGERALSIVNFNTPNLYRYHGKNLIKIGKYKEAQKLLDIAIEEAKENIEWYGPMADIYSEMAIAHLRLGENKAAEAKFNLYKTYADSAKYEEQKNAVETIETRYQLNQKNLENTNLKKEAKRIEARTKLLGIIGALLLLLLGLSLYFYNIQRKNTKKLSKLNETKNKLFTILAHDLKGPSLIFNNLAKKLSHLITKKDTNRLLELAQHYEESGKKVSGTINRVLEWAISEKEAFANNPEALEILPIVKESMQDFEYEIKQKEIDVDVDIPQGQLITFDPNAFSIIHRNLVHNAIKYAPLKSVIKIRFNQQVKALEYIDNGIGISPNTIQKILNGIPVASRKGTQDETGTGIGLVTCVGLTTSNGSQLLFDNLPGGGTKVSLRFAA
ncbi:MAG: HAMP domain-containing sensor histidine kinase [Bacteroidota bacterium]